MTRRHIFEGWGGVGAPGWRDGGGGCCVFEIFLSFLYFPPRLGGVQDFNHGIYEIRKKETLKKETLGFFSVFYFIFFSSRLFRLKYNLHWGKELRLYI